LNATVDGAPNTAGVVPGITVGSESKPSQDTRSAITLQSAGVAVAGTTDIFGGGGVTVMTGAINPTHFAVPKALSDKTAAPAVKAIRARRLAMIDISLKTVRRRMTALIISAAPMAARDAESRQCRSDGLPTVSQI
jgi:hypothetical protein